MTTFSPNLLHEFVGWNAAKQPEPLTLARPAPKNLRGPLNRTFIADMSYVEHVEGRPDWSAVDAWVNGNLKRGRKLMFVLCSLPRWCEGRKDRWALFEQHCWSLLARYGSDVAYVQAGNEVDTDPNLGYAEPEEALRLWVTAFDVFGKRTVLGSFQSLGVNGEGLQRLARLLPHFVVLRGARGGPAAVAVHLYDNGAQGVEQFEQRLHEARGALIGAGAPRAQLWVTEFGLWRPDGRQFAELTGKQQAAWLRAAMRAQVRAGVEHGLFWHFDVTDRANGGFGFVNAARGASIWNNADTAVKR